MPATFKHLNVVSGLLTAVLEQVEGLEDREAMTYNVILAVHEICTNIVEHAYGDAGGRIKLVVNIEEPGVSLLSYLIRDAALTWRQRPNQTWITPPFGVMDYLSFMN